DQCDHSDACSATFTVGTADELIAICPADGFIEACHTQTEVNAAFSDWLAGFDYTGGCTVVEVGLNVSAPDYCGGSITVNYSVSDQCDHSDACSATFNVAESSPVEISNPGNFSVESCLTDQDIAVEFNLWLAQFGVSGGCNTIGNFDMEYEAPNRCGGSVDVTYEYTSSCEENGNFTAKFTVISDNTPPTPPNLTDLNLECDEELPDPVLEAIDDCGYTVESTATEEIVEGDCANSYSVIRNWVFTDECGNSSTAQQTINISDNIAPTITFVDPLLIGLPDGGTLNIQCQTQDDVYILPQFDNTSVEITDNCDPNPIVVLTDYIVDEGNCVETGYFVRIFCKYTATDECGNSSELTFYLNIIDDIPPVFVNPPADIHVDCTEDLSQIPEIEVFDQCHCVHTTVEDVYHDQNNDCVNDDVIFRTWTAEDHCGNVSSYTQKIYLHDTDGPTVIITDPNLLFPNENNSVIAECSNGDFPDWVYELDINSVEAYDNCSEPTSVAINYVDIPGSSISTYVKIRTYTWTAYDGCGNSSKVSINIVLKDTQKPIQIYAENPVCETSLDFGLSYILVEDNCDTDLDIWYEDVFVKNCGYYKIYTRYYYINDDFNNELVIEQTIYVTVDDPDLGFTISNEALEKIYGDEEILTGASIDIDCNSNETSMISFSKEDISLLNSAICTDELNITYSEKTLESFDCNDDGLIYSMEAKWTIEDVCGNISEFVLYPKIYDNSDPYFIDFENDSYSTCLDTLEMPEFVDDCGQVSIQYKDEIIDQTCEYEYTIVRKYTLTDSCGNVTTGTENIHMMEADPIIMAEENVCDDGSIPSDLYLVNACSGLESDLVFESDDTIKLSCANSYKIIRKWSGITECGHEIEFYQNVYQNDGTPPSIFINNDIVRNIISNNITELDINDPNTNVFLDLMADPNFGLLGVDNCNELITPKVNHYFTGNVDCKNTGYLSHHQFVYLFADYCGNSYEETYDFYLVDNKAPEVVEKPQDITVYCENSYENYKPLVSDASTYSIDYVEIPYTVSEVEKYLIKKWTITDACGNQTLLQQIITFLDEKPSCDILPPKKVVYCNSKGNVISVDASGNGPFTYNWEIEGDCDYHGNTKNKNLEFNIGFSSLVFSVTVTDKNGCSSECTYDLDCVFKGKVFAEGFNKEENPDAKSRLDTDEIGTIEISPNPALNQISISSISTEIKPGVYKVEVYDVNLSKVKEFESLNYNEIDGTVLSIEDLLEGVYILQLQSDDQILYKKFIKASY
ncbi:MAG: T9SS type A sorting domain-containing protein, partial [Saprospiraceae bacterium]|nr:T9SS type A sorting domain-containing protein [Saprospiraceae bacterium]